MKRILVNLMCLCLVFMAYAYEPEFSTAGFSDCRIRDVMYIR